MKVGSENKLELWTAIILGVLALASIGYWMESSGPHGSESPHATAKAAGNRPLINPLDPTLRLDLLDSSQNVKYEGKGRNIFKAGAPVDIERPKTPPLIGNGKQTTVPVPTPQNQTPAAPSINLKFFGMASRAGEQPRIFLSEGESVFVAREGDVIDSRYKVVRITPQSVEIEDLLNNNKQTISLSQG